MERMEALEQELNDMRAEIARQRNAASEEAARQVKLAKDAAKAELEQRQREHHMALEQLRQTHQEELGTLANSSSHTRSLQQVLDQMSESVRTLGLLQQRVNETQSSQLDERQTQLQVQEESLHQLQERLHKQEAETQRERTRLQELVARLELQMREAARAAEEERWKARQEANKAAAMSTTLEEERRVMTDNLQYERQELERTKQTMLQEHKQQVKQLMERERMLSDERSQLAKQMGQFLERQTRDATAAAVAEAERDGEVRVVGEERRRVLALDEELKDKLQEVNQEKARMERDRAWVEGEKKRLDRLDTDIQSRLLELDHREKEAARVLAHGEQSLSSAQYLEKNQDGRLADIHAQLQQLADKERAVSEERAQLAHERHELESNCAAQLCVNCRTPVRDLPQSGESTGTTFPGSVASQTLREILGRNKDLIPLSLAHQDAVQRAEHLAANMSAEFARQAYLVEAEKVGLALVSMPFDGYFDSCFS